MVFDLNRRLETLVADQVPQSKNLETCSCSYPANEEFVKTRVLRNAGQTLDHQLNFKSRRVKADITTMHEIKLELYCKSKSADDLQVVLREAKGEPITCDASGLDIMPTGLVQLLLSAKTEWSRSNHVFEIRNISELCAEKLQLLGLNNADLSTGDAA